MNYNKYKKIFLIFPIGMCFLILFSSFILIHRYYFSLTEIKVDTNKKSVAVSCKLITEDLEDALKKITGKNFDLAYSTEDKEVKACLCAYITDRFKLSVAGKSVKLSFVGFEKEDEVTWCYLESKLPSVSSKKIKISNALLFDFLPEETNIIQFTWDANNRTEKLVNPNKEVVISF
jgi:hypothetical protein